MPVRRQNRGGVDNARASTSVNGYAASLDLKMLAYRKDSSRVSTERLSALCWEAAFPSCNGLERLSGLAPSMAIGVAVQHAIESSGPTVHLQRYHELVLVWSLPCSSPACPGDLCCSGAWSIDLEHGYGSVQLALSSDDSDVV